MEASSILGCTEECSRTSGNESGWTTYIGSLSHENRHYHHRHEDYSFHNKEDHETGNYINGDGDSSESDDSMTSDASSGPTRPEFSSKSNEKSVSMDPSKHITTKYSSRKKLSKETKQIKVVRPRIKVAKDVSAPDAKSAASHIHCATKERKTK